MGNQKSTNSGTQTQHAASAFEGHTDAIKCMKVTDKALYTGSKDGTVRAWSLKV